MAASSKPFHHYSRYRRSPDSTACPPRHRRRLLRRKMSLNIPTALSALRPARLHLPFPGVVCCAAVAQLHSTERHLDDPIDRLANVFLVRIKTKCVLRIRFAAHPSPQCARMMWNAHTVTSQKPQPGNHRRCLPSVQNYRRDCSPPFLEPSIRSNLEFPCKKSHFLR